MERLFSQIAFLENILLNSSICSIIVISFRLPVMGLPLVTDMKTEDISDEDDTSEEGTDEEGSPVFV